MDIEIVTFERNHDSTREKVLGWCKVCLNDKMNIWMIIFKGKSRPFAKFPSFKLNGDFVSYIAWKDQNMERVISDKIMPVLFEKYIDESPAIF